MHHLAKLCLKLCSWFCKSMIWYLLHVIGMDVFGALRLSYGKYNVFILVDWMRFQNMLHAQIMYSRVIRESLTGMTSPAEGCGRPLTPGRERGNPVECPHGGGCLWGGFVVIIWRATCFWGQIDFGFMVLNIGNCLCDEAWYVMNPMYIYLPWYLSVYLHDIRDVHWSIYTALIIPYWDMSSPFHDLFLQALKRTKEKKRWQDRDPGDPLCFVAMYSLMFMLYFPGIILRGECSWLRTLQVWMMGRPWS